MNLQGKTILITGAARIGQEVAKTLKAKGANIAIAYFNNPKEAEGWDFGIKADVSKKGDIERAVKEVKKEFGNIDALVHMAAIYEKSVWDQLDETHFEKNMNVIAKSAFLLGKILGDEWKEANSAEPKKMIFFSDWSVLTRPYKEYLAYNAAKAAVVGITKSLAKELAPHVLVNAIAPGPMMRPPDLTDEENEEVLSKTLLGRWGGAQEIARGVAYLLEADFVTGQVLTIDGGRTIA